MNKQKHTIYCYTNKHNGKKYIGRTINPSQRKRQHKADVKRRYDMTFYQAVRKYGWESFEYEVLEETFDPQTRETYWIQTLETIRPQGYNIKEHDMDMTPEIREKIGKANKGKSRSKEHKKAISTAQKGVPKTKEHKRKLSESHKGVRHSEETKKKLSDHFSKEWDITFPDGHQEIIMNLRKFCKENNLNYGNAQHVASGRKKTHKGFIIKRCPDLGHLF